MAQLDQVNHIIVLMLENRSFDGMLGMLYPASARFDGLLGTETNLDPATRSPQRDAEGSCPPCSQSSLHLGRGRLCLHSRAAHNGPASNGIPTHPCGTG